MRGQRQSNPPIARLLYGATHNRRAGIHLYVKRQSETSAAEKPNGTLQRERIASEPVTVSLFLFGGSRRAAQTLRRWQRAIAASPRTVDDASALLGGGKYTIVDPEVVH